MSRVAQGRSWKVIVAAMWASIGCCLVPPRSVAAGDWPQILGPTRNGVAAADERLALEWPAAGPRRIWKTAVGSGYAGPAVVGDQVFLFHRLGDTERLECFDADAGRRVWHADFPASYQGGIDPDSGPRCVPLIHREKVFVFGAAGDLHCVSRRDGGTLWSRQTHVDFRADEGYFGAGSSPIVLSETLLVNVGGTPAAGIVAFSLDTGETLWQQTAERASYAAPISLRLGGQDVACFVTRYTTLAIDPRSGAVQFEFPFGKRGPTVTAAMPVQCDDRLFLSAAYGVGCVLLDLGNRQPAVVWANDTTLSSHYNTPIYHQGHLYGIHGREDVGQAELRCVELRSGAVKWAVPDYGVAHLILAAGRLLLLQVDGRLTIAEPRSDRFVRLAQAEISPHTTRALPALAHGRLFVRDNNQDQGTLYCLDLAP